MSDYDKEITEKQKGWDELHEKTRDGEGTEEMTEKKQELINKMGESEIEKLIEDLGEDLTEEDKKKLRGK